jgi:hypothetical protein
LGAAKIAVEDLLANQKLIARLEAAAIAREYAGLTPFASQLVDDDKMKLQCHNREKAETDLSVRADFSAQPVTSLGYPQWPIDKAAINRDEW